MSPLSTLREGLTDESLRFAILVGLATVPFTLALSWAQVPDEGVVGGASVSALPLLLAALVVGYRYSDRPTETRRAGVWTGLAASLASVLLAVANAAGTIATASRELAVFVAVTTPLAIVLGVGLTALVTMVVAQVAGWATRRLERRQGRATARSAPATDTDPTWRYAIAAYVLVAPTVLYSVLWAMPDGGLGVALSILGLFVLVPLSVVVLVGLFVDVTAPRSRTTEWIPSLWAYVGVPIGTYVLVYAVATLRGSINPAGDAVYGFIGVLWLAAVVYLFNRYRYDGGRNSFPGLPN